MSPLIPGDEGAGGVSAVAVDGLDRAESVTLDTEIPADEDMLLYGLKDGEWEGCCDLRSIGNGVISSPVCAWGLARGINLFQRDSFGVAGTAGRKGIASTLVEADTNVGEDIKVGSIRLRVDPVSLNFG